MKEKIENALYFFTVFFCTSIIILSFLAMIIKIGYKITH